MTYDGYGNITRMMKLENYNHYRMVQNYLSGFLDLIASIIIFYQSIILYKKKKWYIFFTIPLGVCMVALGCAGFYKKDLDGINTLLFGLTMFYIMKKNHSNHTGVSSSMNFKGWIAAVFAILAGIIRILENLRILE